MARLLRVEDRRRVGNLLSVDDRRTEEIDVQSVLRAGDQRQGRVVVSTERIRDGAVEVRHCLLLHCRIAALPEGARCGDFRCCCVAFVGAVARRVPGGGRSRCLRRGRCLGSSRVLSQERTVLRRLRPVSGCFGGRCISGRSFGRRRLRRSCPIRVTGGDVDRTVTGRMYRRAVWPSERACALSSPGTVMTRLSPSTTTSEPETPRPLTRVSMIS